MHRRTKIIATGLMIVFSTGLFVACGDGSGSDDSGQPSVGPLGVIEDKSTGLTGTDADRNGIRDDVDALIKLKYSETDAIRKVAEQRARAIQALMVSTTKEDAMRAADATMRAARCQFNLPIDREVKLRLTKELQALTANTKERITAFYKADALLNGEAFLEPAGILCN